MVIHLIMKLSSRTKRAISDNVATCSLLLTLALLIAICLLSYLSVNHFLRNNRQVTHTYQVMEKIRSVLSDLKDAETGQRGYLLTGDRSYLQPYYAGKSALTHDMDALRALTRDNLSQQRRVDALQALAASKIAELDQTIALRQQAGPAAALRMVRSGNGKRTMDRAREIVARMRAEEERLLKLRTGATEKAGVMAQLVGVFGGLVSALFIVLSIRYVGKYLRERERSEAENLQLVESARLAAVQQRIFLKDVLASVTEGKLALCDTEEELPSPLPVFEETISLGANGALKALRHAAARAARVSGFTEDRVQDFVTSVSEAAMNAVTHGGGGEAIVRADGGERVQVWVTDQGKGIAIDVLPQSTLERGYSSAGSLGHGFWLMLRMCDKVWLLTGPQGTTVILEQAKSAQDAAWMRGEGRQSVAAFKTVGGNGNANVSDVKNLTIQIRTF
jgi:CHASE3 domain sensor protein/anti-sigma regulatory factor (Ser/Thr protein kinase)